MMTFLIIINREFLECFGTQMTFSQKQAKLSSSEGSASKSLGDAGNNTQSSSQAELQACIERDRGKKRGQIDAFESEKHTVVTSYSSSAQTNSPTTRKYNP